jgi:hypothetical protein
MTIRRARAMSDVSQGPGWWQASDAKWYPPESAPGAAPPGPAATPYPQPGAQPYAQPYPQQYGQPYAAGPMGPKTEPMAIASLVCAIAGTVFALLCGIGVLATIAAIPLGFVARRRIRESSGALTGDGMALAGLIIGIVVTVGFVLLIALVVLVNVGTTTT